MRILAFLCFLICLTSLVIDNTLVITIGNVRGGLIAWESLRRHVLEPLKADLFVLVGVKKGEENRILDTYLLKLAKWYHFEPEHDDWGVVLDRAMKGLNGTGRETEYWTYLCNLYNTLARDSEAIWLGGLKRSTCVKQRARAASQLAMRFLVLEQLLKTDKNGEVYLSKYTRFILTRTDYVYLCNFPPLSSLSPDYLWSQDQSLYGGYCDRITVMSQQNIQDVLNWPVALTQDPQKWSESYKKCSVQNFEQAWKCYIDKPLPKKMKFFTHPAVVVQHKSDSSAWGVSKPMVRFNHTYTQIKYMEEYNAATKKCGWGNFTDLVIWLQQHTCDGIIYSNFVNSSCTSK
eukprot:g35617.t1